MISPKIGFSVSKVARASVLAGFSSVPSSLSITGFGNCGSSWVLEDIALSWY